MPTRNRRTFIPLAIQSFLTQDWPEKELVVVDDGEDPIFDLIAEIPKVHYVKTRQLPIGAKRNLACETAVGEIICHWDDDDISEPDRISKQVQMLQESGKSVVGFDRIRQFDMRTNASSEFSVAHACGTSLCYKRDYWKKNKFEATSFGEDWTFAERAKDQGQLYVIDGRPFMLTYAHAGNSCYREPLHRC